MTPGKAASQAGHAFLASYLKADAGTALAYKNGGGTKIVLTAADEPSLWQLYKKASDLLVPCFMWVEDGHVMPPTFDGNPIITALGIGPVDRNVVKPLLRNLKLMK